MGTASRLLSAVLGMFRSTPAAPPVRRSAPVTPTARPSAPSGSETVEIDPPRRLTLSYAPKRDNAPDGGEIVWTWVPYEERDGRGKDRPVLVVAAEPGGTVLAVQLTSQAHPDRSEYVPIGT